MLQFYKILCERVHMCFILPFFLLNDKCKIVWWVTKEKNINYRASSNKSLENAALRYEILINKNKNHSLHQLYIWQFNHKLHFFLQNETIIER